DRRTHAHQRYSQDHTLRGQSQEDGMRDRPQAEPGSQQAIRSANGVRYGTTLVQAIVVALMLAQLGLSQTLFDVRNPKNQKWPEAEANRIYMSTARAVAAEFKLPQPMHAHFTLILGADANSVAI